jgi:hypothetical protein
MGAAAVIEMLMETGGTEEVAAACVSGGGGVMVMAKERRGLSLSVRFLSHFCSDLHLFLSFLQRQQHGLAAWA